MQLPRAQRSAMIAINWSPLSSPQVDTASWGPPTLPPLGDHREVTQVRRSVVTVTPPTADVLPGLLKLINFLTKVNKLKLKVN